MAESDSKGAFASVRKSLMQAPLQVRVTTVFPPSPPPRSVCPPRPPVEFGRALLTRRAGAGCVQEEPWEVVRGALDMHRARITGRPDVLGVGLAYRRRGGGFAPEPCLTVYVRRKWSPGALRRNCISPLPTWLEAPEGGFVPVDVVEAGALTRHLACGARVGRGGLGVG